MKTPKQVTVQEAGRRGGNKVFAERGNEYFSQIANKRWAKVKAEKKALEAA